MDRTRVILSSPKQQTAQEHKTKKTRQSISLIPSKKIPEQFGHDIIITDGQPEAIKRQAARCNQKFPLLPVRFL